MDELLKAANDRLKLANTGITIFKRGSKLSLRGMMPAKPPKTGKSQQTIALDVYANPAGIKRAESEARILSGKLALGQFNWDDYQSPNLVTTVVTVGELIESFERDYFDRRERNPKSETTWKVEYLSAFAKLDKDKPLDRDALLEAILSSKPDSRTRKRLCWVYNSLAKFGGLEGFDASAYAGRYRFNHHKIRQLPTDEEIVAMRDSIESETWRFAFSLMAAYGLRNHEVFLLDLEGLRQSPGIVAVTDGKTGPRKIWPFRPEWWDAWRLCDGGDLPDCTGKNHSDLGSRVTKYFKRKKFCKPMDLRHAWAVRTLEMGLDISLAAQQMGHSLAIHSEIYHDFISDRTHQKAFDAISRAVPPCD